MYKNQTIRSLVAVLMLLLFAVSVAPKQLLHDVITRHKHNYISFYAEKNYQAPTKSFNCTWHNQLVESPFTYQPDFEIDHPSIAYCSYLNRYTLSYYSTELFFSSLRGLPILFGFWQCGNPRLQVLCENERTPSAFADR